MTTPQMDWLDDQRRKRAVSSDDIVERLRIDYVCDEHTWKELEEFAIRNDAADEIVRLRKRLQACQSNDDYPLTDDCITQNERFLLADNERLRAEVERLRAEVERLRAEVERLRAAGDALAVFVRRFGDVDNRTQQGSFIFDDRLLSAVVEWQEARRG